MVLRKEGFHEGRPFYKRLGKGKCDGKMEDFWIYYKDGFWVIGANLWSLCAIASLQSHVLVPLRKYVVPEFYLHEIELPLKDALQRVQTDRRQHCTKWKVYSENRHFDLIVVEDVYEESPATLMVRGVRPPRICTPNGVYKKLGVADGRPFYKNVQEKHCHVLVLLWLILVHFTKSLV
eukprot:TRINITY_DN13418_c0_g1_i1.p1 TRINITY_DN13418_c0_g1~~TRINITY_DN13418_c0_g1_i1.p1  ORF type:complete len:178 (-),score=27.00 TRINITY_DN13418_c0_g1_i1:397-930(-)